jgi:two-component system heavy metal sensor histidine kinase CusS
MVISRVLLFLSSLALETRFTLLFALISLPVLIATSLGSLVFVNERSRYYEERNLSMAAGLMSLNMASLGNAKALAAVDEHRLGVDVLRSRQISLVARDSRGADLAGALPAQVPADVVAQSVSAGTAVDWSASDTAHYRVLAADARLGDGTAVQLVLMLNVSTPSSVLHAYRNLLIASVLGGVVLIMGFGLMFTQIGLEPLRRLADKTRDITASRLGERMGIEDAPAELRELSQSLNDMLQRLQDSFRRLDEFSSDLAHELRTPIGNMLGQSEVALSRARSVEEYRAVLESNIEEFQRLSRMIQDMLFLAQSDNSERALTLEEVDLKEQVDKVLEYYEPVLEEKNIRVLGRGAGTANVVRANRLLVQRAIANLISNAVRHAPRDTDLDISIGPLESGARVWVEFKVSNAGSRIPLEDIPWIFQRFFRGDAAKAQLKEGQEGWGLGLSIVKAIMDMHGGEVKVQSEEGLTSFTLRFPREPTA